MKKLITTFLIVLFTFSTSFCQQFQVSFSSSVLNEPFNGNVFLLLSKYHKIPMKAETESILLPCHSIYIKDAKPESLVIIDDKATSYPVKLSDMERGEYFVQAVLDRNLGGRSIGASPGNIYSQPVKVTFTKDTSKIFKINCDQIIPEQTFAETETAKELKVSSTLLTDFHNKPISINAAVLLPAEYFKQLERRFPVCFIVFGYGGDYHSYSGITISKVQPFDTTAIIRVFMDGNCPLGHSVYANSENNGPWGDAFIEEFIPELEKQYRCNGARFITGHSSGGWSSLWLQTHYPTVFAGCWASSPDPVDFRSFLKINLYSDRNIFYDKDEELRSYATLAGRFPWIYIKDVYQMENVISRGEQMRSFEAVFGKKAKNGNPERLGNPNTGEIDSLTITHWKDYDLSLYLRTNWNSLRQYLDGKIRISVGNNDNWVLNHSIQLLEDEMNKMDANILFTYYTGDHFTVFTYEYRNNGFQFLEQKYKEWLDKALEKTDSPSQY